MLVWDFQVLGGENMQLFYVLQFGAVIFPIYWMGQKGGNSEFIEISNAQDQLQCTRISLSLKW